MKQPVVEPRVLQHTPPTPASRQLLAGHGQPLPGLATPPAWRWAAQKQRRAKAPNRAVRALRLRALWPLASRSARSSSRTRRTAAGRADEAARPHNKSKGASREVLRHNKRGNATLLPAHAPRAHATHTRTRHRCCPEDLGRVSVHAQRYAQQNGAFVRCAHQRFCKTGTLKQGNRAETSQARKPLGQTKYTAKRAEHTAKLQRQQGKPQQERPYMNTKPASLSPA